MKAIQIESGKENNDEILRTAGVSRIHRGWYTVTYNGIVLDCSTVTSARRNRDGEIKYDNKKP